MLKKSIFLSMSMLAVIFAVGNVTSAATSNNVNTQRAGITIPAIGVAGKVGNNPATPVAHDTEKVDETTKLRVQKSYGKLPLSFIKNNGQLDEKVKYYERGSGHSTYFTDKGVYLSLTGYKPEENVKNKKDEDMHAPHSLKEDRNSDTGYTETIKLIPINANKDPEIIVDGARKGKINYLIGNDPKKWNTNIPTYQSVTYREVYDGIDMKFYGNNSQMEYDIIVKPGASPSKVKLQYDGVEGLSVTEKGELEISLKSGKVLQKKLYIYQEIDGKRINVGGQFKIINTKHTTRDTKRHNYGFTVASYDKNRPLIIDPVLSYSTYLGGTSRDIGHSIAVDISGNAYVTGLTYSFNFPLLNEYQSNMYGPTDVFVTKLDPNGGLSYSTYLGGNISDHSNGIAVDTSGNAYVTGSTNSTDFPLLNEYQSSLYGYSDVFVTKLDSNGVLSYSTYLGGNDYDYGNGIAVDTSGQAYVTGYTASADFPLKNEYQGYQSHDDAFVVKLSKSGNLYYSTHLGGDGYDHGSSIAVDTTGYAYVTGYTASADFPLLNEYQGYQSGKDAFVTKLDSNGGLSYSTYLGGNADDLGRGIAVDTTGYAYVTGYTASADFPLLNEYQGYQSGKDAFVTKLDSNGGLSYSTYLGGNDNDYGYGIAVDTSGYAYVTGYTASADFPLLNEYQGYQSGKDAFVTKLDSNGGLSYSTYLGGNDNDYGYGIAVDTSGNTYVTGRTDSYNFPLLNEYQGYQNSSGDAFVTKLLLSLDNDSDGMPDIWELNYGLNPDDPTDAFTDIDGDMLDNLEEYQANTDPTNADTDFDWIPDKVEIDIGLNPLSSDTDGDGVLDGNEDDDHDGLSNWEEVNLGTDLQVHDTDGDGFIDGYENARGTDPNNTTSIPTVNIYVDSMAPYGGDGTIGNPYNTIQAALDAAIDYDLIQVADGTYTGIGNKDLDYAGKSLMLVSENGADNCIIDCEGSGRGFVFENGEKVFSVLEGVTIQNGGNYGVGGGILFRDSNPTIQNCTFRENRAGFGGCIYCSDSNPIIRNCTIQKNRADRGGGGIACLDSSPIILNCTIKENNANFGGGIYSSAIYSSSISDSVTIQNCTIVNNFNDGIYYSNIGLAIKNTILWANTGLQLRRSNPQSADTVIYSLVQGGRFGEGNIDVDPQFVTGSFRLKANSPCIDAGSNENASATDIDGESRWDHPNIVNVVSSVDIGADEFVDTDGDNIADIWEMEYFGDLSHDGSFDSDGDGSTDIEEYENGTNPNNSDPIIISTPVTIATENVLYQYDVDATDGDGDSLVYSLAQNPTGMSIDASTGIISWTPVQSDVGTHPVSVNVDDGNGGSATKNYNVTVANAADTTIPVITLLGSISVNVEVGTTYTDAGATASDNVDGDITANIVTGGLPDTNVLGIYTVTYDVTDSSGNAAIQATRTVNVTDSAIPVITLSGSTPVNIEVGTAYNDAGATASDNVDGNITASIITNGLSIDTNVLGSYTITYDVTDSSGNAAVQVTRTVNVTDTEIPVITLSGSTPVNVEVGTAYNDAGATASDNVDGNITASIITGDLPIDTSTPGSYTVTYDVTDSSGNAAVQVTRTVNVTDTEVPVITLSGSTSVDVEVGVAYNDAGATASDNVDGNITASIVTGGLPIDTNTPGSYIVTYDVTDSSGNTAVQVTRTVNVTDTEVPVITLSGSTPVNVEVGTAYNDASATALDNVDGNITANITTTGLPINTSTLGSYIVTYDVTDSSGNAAVQVTRTVNVTDTSTPVAISSVDFESGWDIWNDGGGDSRRNSNDAAYANSGSYCVRLKDDTSTSVMTTDDLDLSIYSQIEVQFSYYCVGMDDSNEDFWLQISTDGGASFTTVEEWNFGDEFLNNERHNETVVISGISLSSNTKLRFRCDGSNNSDVVYIDDVIITAVSDGGSGSSPEITQQPTSITVTEPNAATFTVSASGNPAPTYQWRKNGTNIVGATSNSYTLNPTSFANDNGTQFDVVVSNSQGSVTSQSVTLNVLEPSSTVTISSVDFESGWDIWNDGGDDARRSSNDAAYANSGSYCVRLRDNTSTSVMTTDNLDLSIYSQIEVQFSYYCVSMDKSSEDFWLQVSTDGGSSFITVEEWNLNDEFLNDERHNETVVISGISLSSNTKLRFRCDASGNKDWVYIDDVIITAR